MGKPQQTQVEFSKNASVYLSELAFTLLVNDVFSYIESAENYVDFISDEIIKNINLKNTIRQLLNLKNLENITSLFPQTNVLLGMCFLIKKTIVTL